MTDSKFMTLAIEKAMKGISNGQTPFGACIVKGKEVISCEHNRVWETTDITAHAEIVAIREACKKLGTIDLSGCEIYATTEPCPMCFSAIHWAKIGRIIYGTGIQDAMDAGFSELTISDEEMRCRGKSPVKVVGNFMREENLALFRAFKERPSKRIY